MPWVTADMPAWSSAMKTVLTTIQTVINMSTNASVIKSTSSKRPHRCRCTDRSIVFDTCVGDKEFDEAREHDPAAAALPAEHQLETAGLRVLLANTIWRQRAFWYSLRTPAGDSGPSSIPCQRAWSPAGQHAAAETSLARSGCLHVITECMLNCGSSVYDKYTYDNARGHRRRRHSASKATPTANRTQALPYALIGQRTASV